MRQDRAVARKELPIGAFTVGERWRDKLCSQRIELREELLQLPDVPLQLLAVQLPATVLRIPSAVDREVVVLVAIRHNLQSKVIVVQRRLIHARQTSGLVLISQVRLRLRSLLEAPAQIHRRVLDNGHS